MDEIIIALKNTNVKDKVIYGIQYKLLPVSCCEESKIAFNKELDEELDNLHARAAKLKINLLEFNMNRITKEMNHKSSADYFGSVFKCDSDTDLKINFSIYTTNITNFTKRFNARKYVTKSDRKLAKVKVRAHRNTTSTAPANNSTNLFAIDSIDPKTSIPKIPLNISPSRMPINIKRKPEISLNISPVSVNSNVHLSSLHVSIENPQYLPNNNLDNDGDNPIDNDCLSPTGTDSTTSKDEVLQLNNSLGPLIQKLVQEAIANQLNNKSNTIISDNTINSSSSSSSSSRPIASHKEPLGGDQGLKKRRRH